MIALLLPFQLVVSSPTVMIVRNASRSEGVPLVATATGPAIHPEALSPIVPVVVRQLSPGHYAVTIAGVEARLEVGVANVTIAGRAWLLVAPPSTQGAQLLVPLQFVSEVMPRALPNLRWDAERQQLVVFSAVSPRLGVSTAPTGSSPTETSGALPAFNGRSSVRKAHRIVVVDAGHGGPDNGMTGPIGSRSRIVEKDITLSVAKKLGAQLQRRGVDVVYTRTTDTLIALSDRGRIANRANGDLFISVHVNAANPHWRDPSAARGFETYFLAEARTEDARRVEEMENEAVRFENGPSVGKGDPLGFILSDMKQNEHLRESSELAEIIQKRLGHIHPGPSRGVKQAGFIVLVTAYMPAALVEIGFGTNPAEAEFISNPANQVALASAIADAAIEYLRRYQRRVGGTVVGLRP